MKSLSKIAALYARVSTEAQREEGYSIDAQKEMLEAYCVSKQIKTYRFYVDGGYSGSSVDRPEMQKLISDIKENLISHVIVYKLDRLSRSQKDTLYLIEDVFIPHSVSFVSLNENMDTSTPIGRAMLGIMSAFAQLERETIRERTRIGMRERVKRGLWMGGGHVPFGYDYDSEKGILVPNGDADTVRLMYDLYLKGWSMMKIAKTVGLKYERLAQQIIMRKTNTGVINYNGVDYEGLHEPIVSKETYEAAMRLMRERSKGKLTTAKSLLAGLLYCGVCGAKMRYQKWGRSGYKIYCYSQDPGKPHLAKSDSCDNDKVWADEIEDIVIRDLFSFAKIRNKEENSKAPEKLTDVLEKQKMQVLKKLKTLYNLYAQDEDAALLETIGENKEELERINSEIKRETESSEISLRKSTALKELDTIEQAWDYMTVEEKQNVLRSYIEKIVITRDRTDIYYKI